MPRPKYPQSCIMSSGMISRINQEMNYYDKDPERAEREQRLEKERHEREQEELREEYNRQESRR